MKAFDLCAVSLAPATTLIEASAGTGKTYSITGLMIRLLLERNVPIGQIVAVTFTEAATRELRERARARLAKALQDLRAGVSEDPVVLEFLTGGDIAQGVDRLNLALQSFDEAQIFTIHGFCQRCLTDYAFASGAQFDTKLAPDATPFYEEIAHDFWRQQFQEQKPLLAAVAVAWKQSPAQWIELLQRTASHPDLVLLPPAENVALAALELRVEQTFAAARTEWQRQHTQISRLLEEDRGLSRAKDAFHPERVADLLSQLALACEGTACAAPECIGALAEVCSAAIAEGTTATGIPPVHPFFDLCGEFCRAVTALLNGLTREMLTFARTELPRRKARANTITYDDLVLGLRDALRGPCGAQLAESIGRRYQAALIDEFQDTDPAQYEIFRTIFGAGQHCLFYIGDPKQAIYGFRGADIFTYRQAADAARQHAFTLTTNWRSEPQLLAAFNTLFQQTKRPFVFDWIDYHPVHAPAQTRVVPLSGFKDGAALRLRLLDPPPGEEAFNQEDATALVSSQVATDIAELYAAGSVAPHRPLRYNDVAILVRKNKEAETIQESLRRVGLRSILRTESNVFAAPEAEELDRFLRGVLEPRHASAFKGALASTLLGLDARGLYELELDDRKRQEWLERFLNWQEQWVNGCFIALFRRLLAEQSVRVRLVKLPGGERRLTNFLQLAELLHEAETSRHLSPDAVCAFLSEQRAAERTAEEQFQLRLESDQDAIHIVTVHKAKGLEYPIVFCPFLWKPAESKNHTELLFHDRKHNDRLTFDLREKEGGEQKHQDWQSEETRSEELRLTYVALTRAMNRCYVYIPAAKTIAESPLALLLDAAAPQSIAGRIRSLVDAARGSIDAVQVTGADLTRKSAASVPLPPLAAREFNARISNVAMSASFTGLNTDVELDRETLPGDEIAPPAVEAVPGNREPTIFTFPRGASAGDFFHDVLENLDLAQPDQLDALITAKLKSHGFSDPGFPALIRSALRNLLETELEPGLRLGNVRPPDILRELDFTYPLKRLTPGDLRDLFLLCPDIDGAVSGRLGRLQFRPVEGFMRGFIDVLFRCRNRFYIIDWKSNWLGGRAADYQPARLRAAMLQKNYYLQYHLYTLAVDLFLRSRFPAYQYDTHFGGVFYVFLRGVDPRKPQQGIFRDRPSAQTVAALRRLLP